jgi:signal transduction histidine kinase
VSRATAARLLSLVPLLAFALAELALVRPPFLESPIDPLFDASTGVVLAMGGVVAWTRRPERRSGRLLVLAGYLWYVGSLYIVVPSGTLVPFLGFALRGYYDPILAFVVLTFPGDRLARGLDRTAVRGLLAAMVMRSAWRLAGPQTGADTPDPPWAALFPRSADLFVGIDTLLSLGVALALLAVAIEIVRRWRRSRAGVRFVTDPVLAGGAIWAAVASLYGSADFLHLRLGIDLVPWDGPGWTAQYLLRTLGPLGLLLGALRLRNRSAAVVALIAGRAAMPRGPELERALRTAFDDPTLVLVYPDGADGWATGDGTPTLLPAPGDDRVATILEDDGRRVGALILDALLVEDPSVVRTLAAFVRLAVDNDRLQGDLRGQLEEVRASRTRIVEAADAERRHVERDLHDGAQQRLVALAVSLRTIRTRLGSDADSAVVSEVDAASGEVKAAIAELRELTRGLDPAILREAGLGPAIQSLADRSPVPVTVTLGLDAATPAPVERAAYFVVAEALANVAKHAGASSVTVSATREGDTLVLEVTDDGRGGADPSGAGLRGLADRIAALDGAMRVSTATGGGTRLVAEIPCAS